MKKLMSFVKDDKGLETVEWVVMAGLIVLGIVATVVTLQGKIGNVFDALGGEMDSAAASGSAAG